MARPISRARWILALPIAFAALAATPAAHPAPVTFVAVPWGTATIDGGEPFVIPSTVLLEPGEYRVRVVRDGFSPVETIVVVRDGTPQNHLIRLERR